MEPRIWLIAGPTASGKSALALRLAQAIDGEIVGADSMQIYRGLEILTAAPTAADRAAVPHHLVGVADPAETWSVGRWLAAASDALAGIAARGRPAIVAGGTGLYFRALTHGLADIPAVPAEVRDQASADYEVLGEAAFRERLAGHDPAAASRIAPGDRRRLCRAWEVFAATGTALSDWQAASRPRLAPGSWRAVALDPPRAVLHARCDARLQAMAASGALDEVAALLARNLDPRLPAMKAVGVPDLGRHVRGEISLPAALAAAQAATRQYAKRQSTWLRGQMADWPRIEAADPEDQWRQFLALHPILTG
jgi:tRNA dimethylallyltransferase